MKNIGLADQVIRAVIGAVLLYVGLAGENLWWIAGAILLATSLFRICPAYRVLKFSTVPKEQDK